MRTNFPTITLSLLVTALLFSSCKEAKVRIYDVPKQENALQTSGRQALQRKAPQDGTVVWEKAPHWESLPPTAFRKGNYRLQSESGTVEITVSSFPGEAGGMLANINRWLGQAKLPAITPTELVKLVESRSVSREKVAVVDLNPDATQATRIYAAILKYAGQSWFFKMSGPGTVVGEQRAAFDQMIETLAFPLEKPANQPPANATREIDELNFTAPQGWVLSTGSAMRIASYKVLQEGSQPADFSITSFPGETGGTLANVNRWRRQIGLPAWANEEVQKAEKSILTETGLKFQRFDLKANNNEGSRNDRILVAILRHNGKSWFFKLRGEVFLLETQRDKFNAILQSVHFHQEDESHDH